METRCVICVRKDTCNHPEPIVDEDGDSLLGAFVNEPCENFVVDASQMALVVQPILKFVQDTGRKELAIQFMSSPEDLGLTVVIMDSYDDRLFKTVETEVRKQIPKTPLRIVFMICPEWMTPLATVANVKEIKKTPGNLGILVGNNMPMEDRETLAEEMAEALYVLTAKFAPSEWEDDLDVSIRYEEEALDTNGLEEIEPTDEPVCPICGTPLSYGECTGCGYKGDDSEDPDA